MKLTDLVVSGIILVPLRTIKIGYLLHFGRCTPKQFDIPRADQISVLAERLGSVVFVGEQHERVARRTSVRFFNEQNAVFRVHHGTGLLAVFEKGYLETERERIFLIIKPDPRPGRCAFRWTIFNSRHLWPYSRTVSPACARSLGRLWWGTLELRCCYLRREWECHSWKTTIIIIINRIHLRRRLWSLRRWLCTPRCNGYRYGAYVSSWPCLCALGSQNAQLPHRCDDHARSNTMLRRPCATTQQ